MRGLALVLLLALGCDAGVEFRVWWADQPQTEDADSAVAASQRTRALPSDEKPEDAPRRDIFRGGGE